MNNPVLVINKKAYKTRLCVGFSVASLSTMLVPCGFFAFSLLSLVSAEFPFENCASKCELIAFQERITVARELLTQSEAYAQQWRSDCSTCTTRRQSYLNAAIGYLDASGLDLEGPGIKLSVPKNSTFSRKPSLEKAVKAACPSWKNLESAYV